MRPLLSLPLLLLSIFTSTLAIPQQAGAGIKIPGSGPARLNNGAGMLPLPVQQETNLPLGVVEKTVNYLVTLSRSVSNKEKDKIFDYLMQSGAVVKQVYDYRVSLRPQLGCWNGGARRDSEINSSPSWH
ncbi:hypothetical protein P7C70_g3472, partial [Phenoliferia sp. Uapishka_3]